VIDDRLWDQISDDMGWNDTSMERNRPYNGQPHTSTGIRGATEIRGVTFRDLRDSFIRAYCLSLGAESERNKAFYREAEKGEHAALCENDLHQLDGTPDPMALCQNLSCELERLMGIFPNVPKLMPRDEGDIL
jgi:hypothetical protein